MAKSLLSSVDVFKELESSELEIIEKSAKEVFFPSDTTVFQQGDSGDKMYLIVEGFVEIWKSEGQEMKGSRLARLKQGEIFGEMALFDKEPRSASAITSLTKETKMLVWSDKDLNNLLQTHPQLGVKVLVNFLKKMSGRLRIANDAIHTLLRSNQYIGL
jgi:CRP-like cAMP-binding protein